MDQQKQEIVEKLQSANNILVTVSSNPSVDQLAACIGLTLLLNKLDKHATAVFSGQIPSTIEFLKPEETIEKNTDSLRDFIIALDKTKADKLRYKVEDRVVKIFITPYRTSLSADDLNFSQGDFNIDIVVALGVHQQSDLDQAITAHGRILHDATVACINNTPNGELGTVNWQKTDASSLSELVAELIKSFEGQLLDEQIATALLTGIVAETDRFRNEKTTAATMTFSADLMAAGANQKLVAEELEHDTPPITQSLPSDSMPSETSESAPAEEDKPKPDDGTLEIDHPGEAATESQPETTAFDESAFDTTDHENEKSDTPGSPDESAKSAGNSRSLITEAPTLGGRLTANSVPEEAQYDPSIDPLAGSKGSQPILGRDKNDKTKTPTPPPVSMPAPAQPDVPPLTMPEPSRPAPTPVPPSPQLPPMPPAPPQASVPQSPKHETLTELEESVDSPHVDDNLDAVEKARQEVLRAINEVPNTNLPPVQALNAQTVDLQHDDAPAAPSPQLPPVPPAPTPTIPPVAFSPNAPEQAPFSTSPADQPLTMPMPPGVTLPPPQVNPPTNAPSNSPNPAPPVPPPLMPPNWPPKQ